MRKFLFLFFLITTNIFCSDKFLETTLNVALARDKRILAKKQEVEVAQKYVNVNLRNFFPSAIIQQRFTKGKATPTGSYGEYLEEYQGQDFGLRVYQVIYDGGRLQAAYRYHQLNLEQAKLDHSRLKEDLIYKIKQAYYNYLASTLEIKELTRLLSIIEEYHQKLLNEYKAKAISDLDLKEGEVFVEKIKIMIDKSKKQQKLSETYLLQTANLRSLDEIPYPIDFEKFSTPPKEINYDLETLKQMLVVNNPDLKKVYLQTKMAEERKKTVLGRAQPRFYFDGFWGKSGEAYTKEPLVLTTVWSAMLRFSWFFGGSSVDSSWTQEKTAPSEIIDVTQKIENNILTTQISLFDDIRFYVEKEDVELFKYSTLAEYEETKKQMLLELEKQYNEYYNSLLDARINKEDYDLKNWRLDVLKKKNLLFEVPTIDVMSATYQTAEALINYSRAVLSNYLTVAGIERVVGAPVR
jgi:outer membrane protein TolC